MKVAAAAMMLFPTVGAFAQDNARIGPGGILFSGDRVVRESMPSTAPVVQVTNNLYTTIARRADGTVVAWGDNSQGRAMVPVGLTNVVQIASGTGHTLALKSDGTVVAWGLNNWGETNVPAGLSGVKSVWAGDEMSFAVKQDGSFVYWGHTPAPPAGIGPVVQLGAGDGYVIALRADGTAIGWGLNNLGQTNIPAATTFVKIAVGQFHSIGIKLDGTVVGWGNNGYGNTIPPTGLNNVVDVAVGWNHSLALKQDGTVVAFGNNSNGQASPPATLTNVVGISSNYSTSTAVTSTGKVVGFGVSNFAQTVTPNLAGVTDIQGGYGNLIGIRGGRPVFWGRPDFGVSDVPPGLENVVAVAAGHSHAIALKSDGLVQSWGNNQNGQSNTPSVTVAKHIWAGRFHSMANRMPGGAWLWGSNVDGQLTMPGGLGNVLQIVGGYSHSAALKEDGTVVVWGDNFYGQKNVPAGLSGVVAITSGINQMLALKSDGTIAAWGWTSGGVSSPPAGLTNVVQVSSGEGHAMALRSNGAVVSWGNDWAGQVTQSNGQANIARAIASGDMSALLLKMHIQVAPWKVYGGANATGTVYLAAPAPAGGVTLSLSSSDARATVPATVTVPAGSVSTTFTVATTNGPALVQPIISAAWAGLTQKCLLTIEPSELTVSLNRNTVTGGSTASVKGTVTLLSPAPAGGRVIALTSSSTSCSIPAQITIQAGKISGSFTINHNRVNATANVSLGAGFSTFSTSTNLELTPFRIQSLTIDPSTVYGGRAPQTTVTLNAIPLQAVDVDFSSSATSAVPNQIFTIPAGTASQTAGLTTYGVASTVNVTLTANVDGSTKVKTIVVYQGLTSLKFGPLALYGNGGNTCTLTIPAPAPEGGWTVNLTATGCQVPATVTIPAGSTTVNFQAVGDDVTDAANATIQATAGGSTLTATKAIVPNVMQTFTADPVTFTGGSSTVVTGTITLKAPVAVDTVIPLTNLNPTMLTVPATVTILAGQSSVDFPIGHNPVPASRLAKVNAVRLGVTKTLKLTVNP